MNVRKGISDWCGNWARREVLRWRGDESALGWRIFFGRSRLERRIVLSTLAVLAVLHVGLAGFAELVPVSRLVHQGDTYTIRRGGHFVMNLVPLIGPVFVLGGCNHRLTVESPSGATRVKPFDRFEDIEPEFPFLFVWGPGPLIRPK